MDGSETIVEVELQRNRAIVRSNRPTFLSAHSIHNFLTVFNYKTRRYVPGQRYAYLDKSGCVLMPSSVNKTSLARKLNEFDCYFSGYIDGIDNDLITHKPFSRPIHVKDEFRLRDEYQKEAISFICSPLSNKGHIRLLTLPTGYGKTFCAIWGLCYYNRKTLIIASSLSKQWVREIIHFTDIDHRKIYELSESIDTVTALLSNKEKADKYDIYIATIRTLANAHERGLYVPLLQKLSIGYKIIDEFHVATYTNTKLELAANISETLLLTATAARSDSSENYTFGKAFQQLPSYGENIIDYAEKYLNTIWVLYNSDPTYDESMACNSIYGFNMSRYAKQIWGTYNYNTMIHILKWAIDITLASIDEDEKIVIIVELKEHTAKLVGELHHLYPDVTVGEYTSNVSAIEKGLNLQNQIIVSTNESFGIGIDLRGKLRVLINTISYNSEVIAYQLPGRLRKIEGKQVYYIDLVNTGYNRTYKHYTRRKKIIEKFSKSVVIRKHTVDF
jgi:superfamily II DNA or RNA helicase